MSTTPSSVPPKRAITPAQLEAFHLQQRQRQLAAAAKAAPLDSPVNLIPILFAQLGGYAFTALPQVTGFVVLPNGVLITLNPQTLRGKISQVRIETNAPPDPTLPLGPLAIAGEVTFTFTCLKGKQGDFVTVETFPDVTLPELAPLFSLRTGVQLPSSATAAPLRPELSRLLKVVQGGKASS